MGGRGGGCIGGEWMGWGGGVRRVTEVHRAAPVWRGVVVMGPSHIRLCVWLVVVTVMVVVGVLQVINCAMFFISTLRFY